MLSPLALLLFLAPQTPSQEVAPAQAPAAEPRPSISVPDGTTDEARALWERTCEASGGSSREPLSAFWLKADVVVRAGVQRNEGRGIDYAYLAPDCIRFELASGDQTGRYGPAKDQYWLSSANGVVTLSGREYKEDRKAVDDMLALARNYVALTDPGRLSLLALELMPTPPADLGKRLAKETRKLTWLALESTEFALVRRELQRDGTVYRVELGLRADGLPAVAIVRERGKSSTDPLLVVFSVYEEQEGFRIPFQLRVHMLDRALEPARFAEEAAQEVYVTKASLLPEFQVEDFVPARK